MYAPPCAAFTSAEKASWLVQALAESLRGQVNANAESRAHSEDAVAEACRAQNAAESSYAELEVKLQQIRTELEEASQVWRPRVLEQCQYLRPAWLAAQLPASAWKWSMQCGPVLEMLRHSQNPFAARRCQFGSSVIGM
jgi:hypothetical protein